MQSQQPTVGELFADRYQIEKVLGKGGMGQVFLAHDSLLEGTPVALKIISPEFTRDASYLKKFLREIQLARQVTHPNVARTFEAGTFQNQLFFVMELVKGGELGQLLGRGGMPIPHALPLIIQICDGLIAIHDVGVVHGDLKPANLMLASDGMVKITDFGIARAPGAQRSGEEVVGSPRYMAPELWRGEGNSQRSDLYALGIILYEIVTGRSPFDGENDSNAMYVHLATEPLRALEAKSTVPEWLDELIMSLLAKDARERPKSVKAVREIIDVAVNGSPDAPTYIFEVTQNTTVNKNGASSDSPGVLKSNLPDQEGGRVHNSIDNFQKSLMYNADEINETPTTRFFNWVASFDNEQMRDRMVRGLEGVSSTLILGWLLLYPMTGLQESALGMAGRSNSSGLTVATLLFIFAGVAALLSTPLLMVGRAFLSRMQTLILWVTGTATATVLLSVLCCLHLNIYTRLVDPNGITDFTSRAIHSMRNVVAGSIQAMLLVPFSGLDSVALQAGFVEPSLDSRVMSLIFTAAIVMFYLMLGALVHLLLLRPRGKYVRSWSVSLPAIITGLIVVESCFAGILSVDKLDRLTLPWIAAIQQAFPRVLILMALFNWTVLFAYLMLLMRPAKDNRMPWELRRTDSSH